MTSRPCRLPIVLLDTDIPLQFLRPVLGRRRLRILTWHVHGNYLYYLTQAPHDFYLVTKPGDPPGYAGTVGALPWGDNVHEVDIDRVRTEEFDCILYQHRKHWEKDRLTVLSDAQRKLPSILVEHDPPYDDPVMTPHYMADPNTLLVHVTSFNALMWDNGPATVRVIEHGVVVPPEVRYRGDHQCGIVVVNHLARRGRRLGADLFERARQRVPLDLVGMEAEASGGLGEVSNPELPAFMARYRFFFHPVRWTSLGLAAVEAMMIGMPIVGLAATELSTVIENGHNGYIDTNLEMLISAMEELLADPGLARAWGEAARRTAEERFSIDRFLCDWSDAFAMVTA